MVDSPIALRNTLRRLADWPADEHGVVSAYLDLRPQATQDPNVRTGLVVLRDRLREVGRGADAPPSGELEQLVERLEAEIDRRMPDIHGLALFAALDGRIEVAETRAVLDNSVDFGPLPRLLPLARLADAEQALVALVDTSTLRMFVHRSGALEEFGLVDDDTDDYRQTSKGGWSQARFQRHVEAHREAFAKLAVEALEEVAELEEAALVLLAGDEVAVPLIEAQLSQPLRQLHRGTLRLGMRATLADVAEAALPALEGLRIDDARDAADRLVGAARGDGMAVAGIERTRDALTIGQVMELVVDPNGADEAEGRALDELIRLAAATDARIRIAAEHEALRAEGGVGGLLRFRLDRDTAEPGPAEEPVGAGRTGK